MDWYAWLSKAGLTPAATYEYGLLFSENELEPADAPDFDHDLLKSMGVAIAKHRLEILKLARKDAAAAASANSLSSSVTAWLARKAGRCIARCARRLAGGGGRASTSVVPRICSSGRASTSVTVVPRICSGGGDDVVVRAGDLRQQKRGVKKMVLMITDSGVATGAGGGVRFSSGSSQKSSLMFHDCAYEQDEEEEDASGGEEEESSDGGGAAATGRGEIKWDSMFQDLKPT